MQEILLSISALYFELCRKFVRSVENHFSEVIVIEALHIQQDLNILCGPKECHQPCCTCKINNLRVEGLLASFEEVEWVFVFLVSSSVMNSSISFCFRVVFNSLANCHIQKEPTIGEFPSLIIRNSLQEDPCFWILNDNSFRYNT